MGAFAVATSPTMRHDRMLTFVAPSVILAVLLIGCRSAPRVAETVVADAPRVAELRQKVIGMYPADVQAVHRVLLKARGRELTLTGYILARRSGELRVVAAGDLVGTMFVVTRENWASQPRVVKNATGLRDAALGRAVARDVDALYLRRPSADARLLRLLEGAMALADDLPDGTREEWWFDALSLEPIRYALRRDGRPVFYQADYCGERPREMKITDRELGYEASVRVLDAAKR